MSCLRRLEHLCGGNCPKRRAWKRKLETAGLECQESQYTQENFRGQLRGTAPLDYFRSGIGSCPGWRNCLGFLGVDWRGTRYRQVYADASDSPDPQRQKSALRLWGGKRSANQNARRSNGCQKPRLLRLIRNEYPADFSTNRGPQS